MTSTQDKTHNNFANVDSRCT